jgi:hypothetical protein
VHRDRIAAVAAQNKLPAVYGNRFFVTAGGLISYGPDFLDQYRRAASYIDRILKGEKPGELPVQAPTKYELVINLKTANAARPRRRGDQHAQVQRFVRATKRLKLSRDLQDRRQV